MIVRDFKKYDVWTESISLANKIYKITASFPKHEVYGISQQMQRCAVSIPSNIAEGCSRSSEKEFSRYIQIAIGSSFELETQLILANNLEYYIHDFDQLLLKINTLQKKLNSLNSKLLARG